VRPDKGGCIEALPRLTEELRRAGRVIDGRVGGAGAVLVDAAVALRYQADRLRDDPTINLCDDENCTWCRQLERRANLYRRIKQPRPFQRPGLGRFRVQLRHELAARHLRPPQLKQRLAALVRRWRPHAPRGAS
jgi:hypothetical protein